MIKTPLISVVMAVYNGEKYLRESIDSILKQTCSDFEFIIINDGSIDSTEHILHAYSKADKRIKIIQQENKGLAQSLNNGIEAARGRFLARMDADDIALSNRLEIQSRTMLSNPQIGLCHSQFGLIDTKGKTKFLRKKVGSRYTSLQTKWTLIWRNCICHPSVMLRRSVLEKYRLYYDPSVICQDYDLWCRMIEVTEFKIVEEPLLLLRKHSNSVSSKYDEHYLSAFKNVISRNIGKYIKMSLCPDELRIITLVSGQMYLRGKKLTCRIDGKRALSVLKKVTAKFIELHVLDKKTEGSIKLAATWQLGRWAQQALYHNKMAAIQFMLGGMSLFFSKISEDCC